MRKTCPHPALDVSMNKFEVFRYERTIELLQSSGANIDSGTKWVDLGCNQGQFLRLLISRFGLIKPLGVDDWSENLKGAADAGWDYRQADLEKEIPLTERVDVISALEVLEHIVDTDGFLKRVYDALKPHGWVLITTPNITSLRNRLTVPFGAYPTGLEYRNVIHHVRLYNPAALRQQLHETGFCDVCMIGVSFLPLSSGFGRSSVSIAAANRLPQLCNNFVAVARKPNS